MFKLCKEKLIDTEWEEILFPKPLTPTDIEIEKMLHNKFKMIEKEIERVNDRKA